MRLDFFPFDRRGSFFLFFSFLFSLSFCFLSFGYFVFQPLDLQVNLIQFVTSSGGGPKPKSIDGSKTSLPLVSFLLTKQWWPMAPGTGCD